jgi:hypothetical protein
MVEVYVLPLEAQEFALPQASGDGQHVEGLQPGFTDELD